MDPNDIDGSSSVSPPRTKRDIDILRHRVSIREGRAHHVTRYRTERSGEHVLRIGLHKRMATRMVTKTFLGGRCFVSRFDRIRTCKTIVSRSGVDRGDHATGTCSFWELDVRISSTRFVSNHPESIGSFGRERRTKIGFGHRPDAFLL